MGMLRLGDEKLLALADYTAKKMVEARLAQSTSAPYLLDVINVIEDLLETRKKLADERLGLSITLPIICPGCGEVQTAVLVRAHEELKNQKERDDEA